jgi:signal transduction histidine kinase
VLQDLGLAAGLTSLARSVPNLAIDVDAEDLDLPEHVAISLFRVAQESINNVVKHAMATRVQLRLTRRGRTVHLTIKDDGRGFDVPQPSGAPLRSPLASSGYGLDGMAERVRLLGGELVVRSTPGKGATVEATVPTQTT